MSATAYDGRGWLDPTIFSTSDMVGAIVADLAADLVMVAADGGIRPVTT